MQVALILGVLVLAFAALANSAPTNDAESKAVRVGEGAKAIMVQQVENRRHSGFRNVGNWNMNVRKEFLEGRRYYPTRYYVNDHDDDDDIVDDSGEDYDDGSDEDLSYERPVHRRRYYHGRRPRHHGGYAHGRRRYVH